MHCIIIDIWTELTLKKAEKKNNNFRRSKQKTVQDIDSTLAVTRVMHLIFFFFFDRTLTVHYCNVDLCP